MIEWLTNQRRLSQVTWTIVQSRRLTHQSMANLASECVKIFEILQINLHISSQISLWQDYWSSRIWWCGWRLKDLLASNWPSNVGDIDLVSPAFFLFIVTGNKNYTSYFMFKCIFNSLINILITYPIHLLL